MDAATAGDAREMEDTEVQGVEGDAVDVVAETADGGAGEPREADRTGATEEAEEAEEMKEVEEVEEAKEAEEVEEVKEVKEVAETKAWSELSPLLWQELLHKHVHVCADEGVQLDGWVYTVDPVSASIMLVTQPSPESPELNLCVVMGHVVRSVTETRDAAWDPVAMGTPECPSMLFRPGAHRRPPLSAEEVALRRRALLAWLQRNHVPAEERGEELLVAGGALSVAPPYGPDDCSSANEIILERVRRLVEARPPSAGGQPGTSPA